MLQPSPIKRNCHSGGKANLYATFPISTTLGKGPHNLGASVRFFIMALQGRSLKNTQIPLSNNKYAIKL